MTYAETVKFLVAMIIMMNPLGSLSIYLELTHKFSLTDKRHTALKCAITMTIIMVLTIWMGTEFLDILGITIPSFRCAGGIILLLTGLSMLQSKESPMNQNPDEDAVTKSSQSIAIVPLAIPIIIGPGAMSTLIIAANDYSDPFHQFWLSMLCILLALGMGIILYFGTAIAKFVGESVMKVITRIMGMIIMAIAVGMLANGLVGLIPALG